MIKKIIKKLFPSLIKRLHAIDEIQRNVKWLTQTFMDSDLNFYKLRNILNGIEYYQPAYMVGGLDLIPKRECKDRCRIIEKALNNNLARNKILDIGSSLGYVCYYFSDKGAETEGWEADPKNIEAAKLIGKINGIPSKFQNKYFSLDEVNEIKKGDFDVVIILSVLHHIIHYNGLIYVQELIKNLLDKIPVLVVELALKNEDTTLFWNDALPENELSIFDLVKDEIELTLLGEFPTHLSVKKRPLYLITKRNEYFDRYVIVNNKKYHYDIKTCVGYNGSEVPLLCPQLKRFYYFSKEHVIKEYYIKDFEINNTSQIITDISNLLFIKNLNKIKSTNIIDLEINNDKAIVVLARDKGELISDILDSNEINLKIVAKDVLSFIIILKENNLHHNDIRSWNILWDKEHAQVIDYGLMSTRSTDDDIISLLWVLNAIITKRRESSIFGDKPLPPKENFTNTDFQELYEAIEEGERSLEKLIWLI